MPADSMEKKPGEDEIAQAAQKNSAAAAGKRKRTTKAVESSAVPSSWDAVMCDDVIRSIFARLPARVALASMVLSNYHRRLICSPDFRSLHGRLAPPLPLLHIAYVTTATLTKRSRDKNPVSGFHGFHIAGAAGHSSSTAPMRSIAGGKYRDMRYVNTCNGVVLLADAHVWNSNVCVLWNPAVAYEAKEVTIPFWTDEGFVFRGLGYGRRSQTYKLLVSLRADSGSQNLAFYELGGGTMLRTVTLSTVDGEISRKSIYIDGVIYLVDARNSAILAFDVDNETVTTINLPGDHNKSSPRMEMSNLMELCGRPCVETHDGSYIAISLLTEDYRWERRRIIWKDPQYDYPSIAGVWDCGDGGLVMYLHHPGGGHHMLGIGNGSTNDTFIGRLPRDMTPEWPHYAFCWGYRPTLVSPVSIVGEQLSNDDEEIVRRRQCTANVMEALKPVNDLERRKVAKATLHIVCFMEFLVRIMQQLPHNMQDLTKMPIFDDTDIKEEYW